MLVEFDRVGFAYAGHIPVLDDISLSVGSGEICAFVGRSGVGKTTLLKLVNRLLLPTTGAVSVEGRDTREWDAIRLRRRIGYVFQDVGLFPHMTVEENVSIVPRLEQWPVPKSRSRVDELLTLIGLPSSSFGGRYPRDLSGGQRQRVGLARALAADPSILLMDEPFGALDPLTRAEVRKAFSEAQAKLGTTVMLVTHDIAEALALANRIGVVVDGKLVIYDTPTRVSSSTDQNVRAFMDAVPHPAQ